MQRDKFFVFSDESGSWHDDREIYVRSWIVIPESSYNQMINKVDEIASFLGSTELSWRSFCNQSNYFNSFNTISFRIFVTVSSPADIKWKSKYNITKKFDESIEHFDFGGLSVDLRDSIKNKIYRDIKNDLFLYFYERYHIQNAKLGIEKVIRPNDYDLVYRIDPPQMSRTGWENMLHSLPDSANINIEFPSSHRSQGIQFADVVAGCFRSLLLKDGNYVNAEEFFLNFRSKMIPNILSGPNINPNPNLIFYEEVNSTIKENCRAIWSIGPSVER